MNAYSQDLREKIVAAVFERGMGKSAAARTFGVSLSSVKRYARAASEGEIPRPEEEPRLEAKTKRASQRRLLVADVEECPFATLSQRREYLKAPTGISVSNSTICRELKRMDHTRKKGA